MKLKFKQQDFQTAAVNAVCSLFEGQRKTTATFGMEQSGDQTVIQTEYGIGNALQISASELLANMRYTEKGVSRFCHCSSPALCGLFSPTPR